ncbi:MAG TPA: hypothetical protein VKY85_07615 [Candidatus Angelobacter sp.]|nr:hypothetical protein [Candidatus Angelobacter sp.]
MATTPPLMPNQQAEHMKIVKGPHVYDKGTYLEIRYEHQDFPKWKYHATLAPVLVQNPFQEKELGAGWSDTPGKPAAAPSQAGIQPVGPDHAMEEKVGQLEQRLVMLGQENTRLQLNVTTLQGQLQDLSQDKATLLQQLGEVGNRLPDFTDWTKRRLAAYAFALFELDLDPDKTNRPDLIGQIEQAHKRPKPQ